MMDPLMYRLSRIYGRWGMKAQKYSMVDARGLPKKLLLQWHLYRIVLVLILLFAVMLFLQNMVIFWSAFAANIVMLYCKGILEEKLDTGISDLMAKQKEQENDGSANPV
ncbi:MAG TPA: hypothetical protein VEF76_00720 [Patescibacteria group bacterium]|nr:hypothetical protein [Patescibacteria group bacterium]